MYVFLCCVNCVAIFLSLYEFSECLGFLNGVWLRVVCVACCMCVCVLCVMGVCVYLCVCVGYCCVWFILCVVCSVCSVLCVR